jgi:two-component system LytT family sensor kinase
MNRRRLWINIALWAGLYLCWILVFQKRTFMFSRTMTVEFCYLLFIAANYYFNVFFTIPGFLYKKKYGYFSLLFLAGIMAGALLRVPLAQYLNLHLFIPGKPQPGAKQLFLNSFLNIFIWVICLIAAKLVLDRIRFQRYVDSMEKEKSRTELDFLKAQFNPHFLFNSINSIYGHIHKNNSTARNMLLTFSEMLRYQLYDCNTDQIGIDKELSYIKNYVALQQIRKEEDLIVKLTIDENVKGFSIVPLLFIAFIENAFKYASEGPNTENRVDILFKKEEDSLLFSVCNTKEQSIRTNLTRTGIGIPNVKRRLELLYPDKHQLHITEDGNTYLVDLKLQLS